MSDESRFRAFRGIFMTLCVVLIFVAIARMGGMIASSGHGKEISHPNLHRLFCPSYKTWDYSHDDPPNIKITLAEGCYGDRYILPHAWANVEGQNTHNPGDYASVWCSDHENPERTVEYYEEELESVMGSCFPPRNIPGVIDNTVDSFRLQGQGTVLLTPTRHRPVR